MSPFACRCATFHKTDPDLRAFNFPINLSFGPMIGAIAAGNTVILKPSELSSNCAAVMQKIMQESLDPDAYTVVQGAIPETSALLAQKWDKIFFTGSVRTAKIVSQAAAKTSLRLHSS